TSLRDRIFREVIANLLIHREYLNAFPAKLIIEADRVWCENANRPHGYGLINPATFSPFPKNPIIASFFREIGRADELGSGVKNLYRYCRVYADGAEPQLIEGDVFKTIIPLSAAVTEQAIDQATGQAADQAEIERAVLDYCHVPRSRAEIQEFLGLKHRGHFRTQVLRPLLERGLLVPTVPDRPTSPNQKYVTSETAHE
ncbi:MAG: AAA family ATPase, partial [Gemmatimonadetes bacterium]|nr:AAA family ATPase [Gemmatimonadota bacterium]